MGMLYARASSAESIEAQIVLLDKYICGNEEIEDPAGCKLGVQTWWPQIAALLFNDGAAPFVCNGLNGECELPNFKAWDCDTCKADVAAVSQLYQTEESVGFIVDFLAGDDFCGAQGLDEATVEVCADIISRFMPAAIGTLFGYLEAVAQDACAQVFDGICEPMNKNFWL